ncbi:MAG: hypothetical protein ACE5HE_12380, partial [Phycisphaerae bacterium]
MILLAASLCVVVAALVAKSYLCSPEYLRARAQTYLQQYLRGRVAIGSAEFSWLYGIHLYDVTVTEATSQAEPATGAARPEDAGRVFSCREIILTHDLLSTLMGKLAIRSIVAIEPTCVIARDVVDGQTN